MPLSYSMFKQHMASRSLLEILLKGHLWVERGLNRTLEVKLEVPSAINLDRMTFSAKLSLAHATGAVPADYVAAIRSLNKARNRLAHELSGEPTADDVYALEAALTGRARTVFDALAEDPFPTDEPGIDEAVYRLRLWFFTIVMDLESQAMFREWEADSLEALTTFRMMRQLHHDILKTTPLPTDEQLKSEFGVPAYPHPLDAWDNYDEGPITLTGSWRPKGAALLE